MNILENPFCVLGVSIRDNRKQIVEVAEEKSFLDDSEAVREARSVLTNPRRRLAAEIRWFPGLGDKKVKELVNFLQKVNRGELLLKNSFTGFKSLAQLNFAVHIFGLRKFDHASEIEELILEVCGCLASMSIERIRSIINKDRLASEFPQVEENEIKHEMNDYCADILAVIERKLSALPQDEYLKLIEKFAVEYSDEGGKYYESFLLDGLISSYELKISPHLEELTGTIIDAIYNFKIASYLKEWRKLVRPLVMVAKSRGIENDRIRNQAEEIFVAIREKAVKLHNKHHKTKEALNLILLLKEPLADISSRISEMISSDIRELESLERKRQEAENEYEKYKASLYYETELGLIFQDKLIISADGISWKGVNTPLDEVYGMKWGGTRRYVNGMYMRTDYKITVQAPYITINLAPNEEKYNEIVQRLWRALAGPISERILKQLQSGELLFFGSIKVKDNGVYLKKSGWFSFDVKFFTWNKPLITYSDNGMFIISDTKDNNYLASASYINDMNTHILEAILRRHGEIYPRPQRLSTLLEAR